MSKARNRLLEGRHARLRAEVYAVLDGNPVIYRCVYRRPEQAHQYLRGWHSVTQVDIDLAISRAKQQRGITLFQQQKYAISQHNQGALPC